MLRRPVVLSTYSLNCYQN